MPLDAQTKTQIRTTLLLELNSCFSQLSWHYKDAGDAEREFLQTLIHEIKQCVEGNQPETPKDSN